MPKSKSRVNERPPAHPFGFCERQTEFAAAPVQPVKVVAEPVGKLTLGSGGRLVVPADVRAKLGLQEGDALVATLVDGELRLLPVATAVQRAQQFVRSTVHPSHESVVDQFLRERRAEQLREGMA